jgi:hypothetical protein
MPLLSGEAKISLFWILDGTFNIATMKRYNHYSLLFLLPFLLLQHATAFATKRMNLTPSVTTALRQTGVALEELKDYSGAASSVFGNVRIPAALFAGASAGAAFALPLASSEGLRVGLVKRLYALLMMGALSSQIVAVVLVTLSVASLTTLESKTLTSSVGQLLRQDYELEWVGCRWHFLSGVLMFVVGIGLRAWITIGCPVIAKAALGIIVSAALLCLAFIQDLKQGGEMVNGFFKLPVRYVQLLLARAKSKPLFALAFVAGSLTNIYILSKLPHIVKYLMSVQ